MLLTALFGIKIQEGAQTTVHMKIHKLVLKLLVGDRQIFIHLRQSLTTDLIVLVNEINLAKTRQCCLRRLQ